MTYEIGKHYKTRSIGKVKHIYVFDDGRLLFANGRGTILTNPNGKMFDDINATSPHDIISEWVEPRTIDLYIGYDFNAQEYVISAHKPDMKRFTWFKRTFTEGQE